MTDIELLELPEKAVISTFPFTRVSICGYTADQMQAYARANVAHATAAQEAEIEALRAEVERLRADRDSWEQQASDRVADWYAEHLRAERLAEALREARGAIEDWAGYASDYFREKHDLAGDLAKIDAALAKENKA